MDPPATVQVARRVARRGLVWPLARMACAATLAVFCAACGRVGYAPVTGDAGASGDGGATTPVADAGRTDTPPGLGADASGACPAVCNGGCADGGCNIDADDSTGPIACPDGMPCRVDCSGPDACTEAVDCAGASSCSIDCAGDRSCSSAVACGAGPCAVTCSGVQACGAVACTNAASCAVVCSGPGACRFSTSCATACNVTCTGAGACAGGVDCSAACACDVTCAAAALCPAPPSIVSCPIGCADADGCTSAGACDVCL